MEGELRFSELQPIKSNALEVVTENESEMRVKSVRKNESSS